MPFFIPLGITDFNGKKERAFFQFTYEIEDNDAIELLIQIRDSNRVIYEEKITETSKLTQGEHTWKWDGFDNNGILDTAKFIKSSLNFYATGKDSDGNIDRSSTDFKATYDEVNWVDVRIDKNNKRIDVRLRVNLKDGGANGTEKDCYSVGSGQYANERTVCPWDSISKKDLKNGTPIKTRTKSFEDLEQLALDGLNYHWGRNKNHFIAKNVDINGELYEVFMNAINTTENAMDDVSLIFNTNNSWMRSGNPGTVDDPISFIGNIVSREAICYNVGYIKYSNGWGYKTEIDEDKELKDTSAHEIGHSILKAYGGTFYSYGHKGSVNTVTQKIETSAPKIPLEGEIDIMPYYNDNLFGNEYYQNDYHKRRIASQKDVLSLIWLTKIELK